MPIRLSGDEAKKIADLIFEKTAFQSRGCPYCGEVAWIAQRSPKQARAVETEQEDFTNQGVVYFELTCGNCSGSFFFDLTEIEEVDLEGWTKKEGLVDITVET